MGDPSIIKRFITGRISLEQAAALQRPVSPDEVKGAMFSLGRHKAPGPEDLLWNFSNQPGVL